MLQWLAFPWLRYVLWLLLGVLLALAFPGLTLIATGIGMLAAVAMLVSVILLHKNKPYEQLLWGWLACLLLLSLGYWRTDISAYMAAGALPSSTFWLVSVNQQPDKTPKSYRFKASVWEAPAAEHGVEVVAYLPLHQAKQVPDNGSLLLVKGSLQPVTGPLNPHEFNYQEYLATQGIHYQLFIKSAVPATPTQELLWWGERTALQSRSYLLQVLKGFIEDKQAVAVVSAMVLGQRSELDRSLRQAYADAGVMHVLAVSGLHVGMVYGFIYLLFPYFQRKSGSRIGWLILTLLILWSYAWLTGLAPSAMRATVMFSVIATGKAIKRRGNIYNSIGFSAFILLLWDPLFIRQVGFQLSYLAVIGIVYLQPRISRWYQPKTWWKKKVWEMLAVTLAAQLATFPLGLYYFHQFPTYFFIGNLLAVPLAFLILGATIFLLFIHYIPLLSLVTAWLVKTLAQGLTIWVQLTEQLPLSRLEATISAVEVLLIYGSVISVLVLFRRKSFRWVAVSFCLLLALGMGGLYRTYKQRHQQQFTLYHIPGHSLLHFIQGQQEVLLPLGAAPTGQQLNYHVVPARLHAGLKPLAAASSANTLDVQLPADFPIDRHTYKGIKFLQFTSMRMAIIEGGNSFELPKTKIPVAVILLRNNPKVPLEKLQQAFQFNTLVLDASNSYYHREQIKAEAKSLNLPLHITAEQGAYQINL